MNPVRAGLVKTAVEWPWSSVAAHLDGRDDLLVKVRPLLDRIGRFEDILEIGEAVDARHEAFFRALRLAKGGGEIAEDRGQVIMSQGTRIPVPGGKV